MLLRPMVPEDADAVVSLLQKTIYAGDTTFDAATREEERSALRAFPLFAEEVRQAFSVAVDGDEVVGLAEARFSENMRPCESYIELTRVCVSPERQGEGIGRALVSHILGALENLRFSGVFVRCQSSLVPWYQDAGWEFSASLSGVAYPDGGNVAVFSPATDSEYPMVGVRYFSSEPALRTAVMFSGGQDEMLVLDSVLSHVERGGAFPTANIVLPMAANGVSYELAWTVERLRRVNRLPSDHDAQVADRDAARSDAMIRRFIRRVHEHIG